MAVAAGRPLPLRLTVVMGLVAMALLALWAIPGERDPLPPDQNALRSSPSPAATAESTAMPSMAPATPIAPSPSPSLLSSPPPSCSQQALCFGLGMGKEDSRLNNLLITLVHVADAALRSGRSLVLTSVTKPPLEGVIDMEAFRRAVPCAQVLPKPEWDQRCRGAVEKRKISEVLSAKNDRAVQVQSLHLFAARETTVELMKRLYSALKFHPALQAKADAFVASHYGSGQFTAIHLRSLEGSCVDRAKGMSRNVKPATADAERAVGHMCSPDPAWVRTLVPANTKLFVATDGQDRETLQRFEKAMPTVRFSGQCSSGECVLVDMAIAAMASVFVGNPMSTVSINVARIRATQSQPSVLLRDYKTEGLSVAIWYGYPPNGDDPGANLMGRLPSGFLQYSEYETKKTPECYSRIRSACVDQSNGEVVVFGTSNQPAEELKTCYRRHCERFGCTGYGLVKVRTDTTPGGLEGVIERYGASAMATEVDGAAFLSTWTIEGSLWHVILDNLAGFWKLVHDVYKVAEDMSSIRCPNLDVVFTNDILHGRDEAKCILTSPGHSPGTGCGKWKDAFGLVFYSAISKNWASTMSVKDLAAQSVAGLKCYKDVFIGYPPLAGEYNDRLPTPIHEFGSCLIQNNPKVGMRQRREAAKRKEDIVMVVYNRDKCARKLENWDALMTHLRSRYAAFKAIKGVYFEKMSRDEQVATVADADIFVGPHGSAFGWISVMPRGGEAIVLRGYPNRYNHDYRAWSKWSAVTYTYWAVTDPAKFTLCDDPTASVETKRKASGGRVEMYQSFQVDVTMLNTKIDEAIRRMVGNS
jgi:hypothetical protein